MPKIIATTIDKNGKDHSSNPKIKSGECQFPFIYKGSLIKECSDDKIKGKWCATEVDPKTKKMTKLGFCPSSKKRISIKRESKKTKKDSKKSKKSLVKNNKNNNNNIVLNTKLSKQNSLNQIPAGVLEGMEVFMRPKVDITRVTHWENQNRKRFVQWFDKTFKEYRVGSDSLKKSKTLSRYRPLFTTQKIVRDYLSAESPYRGLLVYHGLGVGKTCASIAIAEANKDERQICVLLQKSIKQNFIGQLKQCGDKYFDINHHWVFKSCSSVKNRETYLMALKIGIPKNAINLNQGAFFIDFSKKKEEDNFELFSKSDKEKINLQIDKMIASKYEFKHTNGLTTRQLLDMDNDRYFDNKVIIIDEVHNIINGMASGGSYRATRLYSMFMDARNARFVFLSGTPMKNIPFEVGKIFNVLRGYIINYIITISGGARPKVEWSRLEDELYKHPLIDQVIIDIRNKEIKLNRTPYGFISTPDGLIKSELNLITDSQFIESVSKFIKERLKYKIEYVKNEETTTFPDNEKEFMKMFYDPEKNDILDKDLFKRRVLGMVSYVASAKQELIPEIREHKVIEVPMSDYMFNKYSLVRKSEIEKDKKKKDKKKKVSLSIGRKKDVKGDIFKANSSYRAYSRMLCQFAFPEDIPRPFKGDIQDLEFDDNSEVANKIVELTDEYEEKIMNARKTSDKEKLKVELSQKIREVKGKSKEYEKRLRAALNELDKNRDKYLVYDNGNPEKLKKYSPKYAMIVEKLLRDRGSKQKGLKFIYTEYKTSEGVGIISIVLNANGYSKFKIKKGINGEWELDFDPKVDTNPKFAVWSGDEESDIILKIFNDNLQELPEKIRGQVEEINKSNRRGQLLEILMTTKQGAEGLNTRNVRQLHIVEPYWNPVRLDQVIGRAVRTNSHAELPKDERNVDIYIYLSRATKYQLKTDITISNDFKGQTSDQVLYNIAERKREIMNIILGIIKEGAIDCSLNLKDNKKTQKNLQCLNFGDIKNRNSFSHTANIKDEIKEKERATRVTKKVNEYKPIKAGNGKKYMLRSKYIYDYDAVESGRAGEPVGEVLISSGKKTVKIY
jgi:hypothetical protein